MFDIILSNKSFLFRGITIDTLRYRDNDSYISLANSTNISKMLLLPEAKAKEVLNEVERNANKENNCSRIISIDGVKYYSTYYWEMAACISEQAWYFTQDFIEFMSVYIPRCKFQWDVNHCS